MIFRLAAALLAWAALYAGLRPAARWFAFSGLGLAEGTRLGAAVEFFVYDTPKVLLLLALVVFVTGVLRTFADPRRVRRTLARLPRAAAHGLAALVGVVTPFCSCSSPGCPTEATARRSPGPGRSACASDGTLSSRS